MAPPRILVVDDDAAIHGFLGTFLEARGYAVQSASSVDAAIGQLRSRRVDAIVLDVKMPGRSGLDVLTHVRGDARLRTVPVLVLTGAPLTPEEENIVVSRRAYVFYKQEDLDEFALYLERLTRAA